MSSSRTGDPVRILGTFAAVAVWACALAPVRAHAADKLTAWLDGLAKCVATKPLSLVVVGFDPRQEALSLEQAEQVRIAIETRLDAAGVRIAPAADVTRLKALREQTLGQTDPEAEAQIRNAFAGAATVFFRDPDRTPGGVKFRLLAITKSADCKVPSEPIEEPVRAARGLSDIDQVMRRAVRDLMRRAPGTKSVLVCAATAGADRSPVRSDCADALAERLLIAFNEEARSPDRVLKERSLEPRRAAPGTCEADQNDVVARATFDYDRHRQSWMKVEFQSGRHIPASTGRTRISVDGLGCDPWVRPFLDYVAASARKDPDRLDIAPVSPFRKGQPLDIPIEAKGRLELYCWVLDFDETAYVLLPVPGMSVANKPAGEPLRYPYDFGLDAILLKNGLDNLVDCFGIDGGLPEALHARWTDWGARNPAGTPKLLKGKDVLDLLEKTRAIPDVVEATARIIVR